MVLSFVILEKGKIYSNQGTYETFAQRIILGAFEIFPNF